MRFFRPVALAIISGAMLLASAIHAEASNVVFGNLGNSGTSNLGSTVTDFGNNPPITDLTQRLAQGFVTGTSANFLTVQSITLGLFAATTPAPAINMTVGIYATAAGQPAAFPTYTSSSVSIGDTARYTFAFDNALLNPSTTYWIIPSTPSTGSWVDNFSSSAPSGRNGSGYVYVSALRFGETDEDDSTLNWFVAPTKAGMSVSIAAVPEPSTYALAGIGIAAAGLMRWRRRQSGR